MKGLPDECPGGPVSRNRQPSPPGEAAGAAGKPSQAMPLLRRRLRQSAIMAMNSLLVGLPLMLDTV